MISFTDWLISFTAGFKDCVVICELLLLFFGIFALAVVVVAVVVIVVVANAVGVVVAATEVRGVAVEIRDVAVYVFFMFFAFVVFVFWLKVSNFALGRWILFSGVQSGCMIFGMGD